ncbi:EmrB/QacA subfamily drug resistance transporter [Rhizobium leguminosarum]|uniref:EmrB/QacA subfamily drug resistance transporter n=1 Tax=Rhizobium leguminosarum TaxID=384 RepID=A0A7Z0DTX6_RHILE|nr:MFS transporter [Rhizobium leguminosarum]NYJ08998.1 EmrB/QacA subfamily drug resistance transporter [Rhizobium leguminosarum]
MTTAETSENGQEAASGRQAKIVALVVAVSFFMQILDGTIVATSLPQMAASFDVQPVSMSIGITVYMLTMAAFIPLSGWLGDRFGARRIFLMSIAVFTAASLFCGLSGSLTEFVLWRAVQGAGSALMTPVGRIIVLKNARKSELVQAIALITWPALTAPVIGPVLGGFITTYASWHWNFLINIPIGILGMALVLRFVPEQRETDPGRLDFAGFVLSAAGLTFLLAALELSVKWDGGLLPLAAGIVLSVMATRHFLAVDNPLLDLSAFRVQTFSMSTLSAGTACRVAINATPFLLPLLFQLGFGLSSIAAGTYLLVYFLGNLGMKTVTTPLLRFFGFRIVLVFNGLIAALSIAACGFLTPDTPQFFIHALLFLAGLSRSMEFTALNTLAFADIGPAQRSSASTLSSMLQQVSMLLGVAVAAAVLNIASALRGADNPVLADFRWAFVVVGAIGVMSSLRFLQLPAEAGAEVSGHRKFQKN